MTSHNTPTPASRTPLPSLAGRSIAIAAASMEGDALAATLESSGARVIVCPRLEIIAARNFARIDEAIEHLYGYDWIVFMNADAADGFLQRASSLKLAPDLDEIRVCAIGDDTGERLHAKSVHVDVVPESYRSVDCLLALERFIGDRHGLQGLNFLILRGSSRHDPLAQSLARAGARVDVVAVYQAVLPNGMAPGKFAALLSAGVDCLVLTSVQGVENLARLFDAPDLSQAFQGIAVACSDEAVAASATQHGLKVQIRSPEGNETVTSLTTAIDEYFATQNPDR